MRSNIMLGQNVVVTGGTGLIGRQVVDKLVDMNANVTVITMDDLAHSSYATYIKMDIRNYRDCLLLLGSIRPTYVFHLAGIKASPKVSTEQAATHFSQILLMNTAFLRACQDTRIENLVYTSSVGVYEFTEEDFVESMYKLDSTPMDPAGWAKRMGEYLIELHNKQAGSKWKSVRLTNTFGPGDNFDPETAMFVGSLIRKVDEAGDGLINPLVTLFTDGAEVRDFLYSKDAAEAIVLDAISENTDSLNIGTGSGYSIRQIVESLQKVVKFTCHFPDEKARYMRRVLDTSKSKELLGDYASTPLDIAIKETWDWYQEFGKTEANKRVNFFKGG